MKELDYGGMGKRIRQVRKAKGWSQGTLAEKCGISMSFMGHIERGTRIMSMDTFAGICRALGAKADELLWGVAAPSDAVLDMWNLPNQNKNKKQAEDKGAAGHTEAGRDADAEKQKSDSYAMYVKIMKSVAEILNEPIR